MHKDYEEQVTYLARSGIADIESFDRDRPVPVTSVHSTCDHQTLDLVQKVGADADQRIQPLFSAR